MRDAGYWFVNGDFYLYYGESPYTNGSLNPFYGGQQKPDVCDWRDYQEAHCYHEKTWFFLTHPWMWRPGDENYAKVTRALREGLKD